jgi:hypothetical protein
MTWLERSIFWRRSGNAEAPWAATSDGHALELRVLTVEATSIQVEVVEQP